VSVGWWVRIRRHPDLPISNDCLDGLNGQRAGPLQLMSETWLIAGSEPIFKVADAARSLAWFERADVGVSSSNQTQCFAHREPDPTIHVAQTGGDELPVHGVLYIHCQEPQGAEGWRRAGIGEGGLQDEELANVRAPSRILETSFASAAPFAKAVPTLDLL
jgi:hypothetical protein